MSGVSVMLELVPIGLAIVSVISCTRSLFRERRRVTKVTSGFGLVCSLILIVAQSSWWTSYAINGNIEGTVWANTLWTIFNTLTMTAFIVMTTHGDNDQ